MAKSRGAGAAYEDRIETGERTSVWVGGQLPQWLGIRNENKTFGILNCLLHFSSSLCEQTNKMMHTSPLDIIAMIHVALQETGQK